MIGVRTSAHMNNVGPAMRAAIESASLLISNNNLPTDGQMISVCHNLNMKSQILEFTRGYVIPASTAVVPTGLSEWSIPTSNAFCVEHVGSYQNIGNSWIAANQHVRNRKLNKAGQGV
jgi:hypothetical protein